MRSNSSIAAKVAVFYMVAGLIYVFAVQWMIHPEALGFRDMLVHLLPGIGFVLATGIALTLCLRVELARRMQMQQAFIASQRMEAVGHLTCGIAHDFNNLLTAVLGNLHLLERDERRDDTTRRRLRNAREAGERGAELTHRLLAFTRRQILEPQVVDANEVIRDWARLVDRAIGESVDVELRLSSDPLAIRIDPGELDNALLNLAINARDAMPDGGTVMIATERVRLDESLSNRRWPVKSGPYAMIEVRDTGTGMTAEVCARVFEPFFTTKKPGKGTGLGLPMVYGFVKQSDGHILIDSEPGKGTAIRLYFPGVGEQSVAARRKRGDAAPPTGTETLLLVENDKPVREVTRLLLEDLGYRVIEAERVRDALDYLQNEPDIGLLIADVILGGDRTGVQLALEALEDRPDLKVLLVSGHARPGAAKQLEGLTPVRWLAKPYTQADLGHTLRYLLDS